MGMRCHRNAKEQYLAVGFNADYWSVTVTEEAPETYLCSTTNVASLARGVDD